MSKSTSQTSNDNQTDAQFWSRADAIIAVANQQCSEVSINQSSASLLYAAARFNAFNVANACTGSKDMKSEKAAAIRHFTEQYTSMLEENIDDYINNFDQYMKRQ